MEIKIKVTKLKSLLCLTSSSLIYLIIILNLVATFELCNANSKYVNDSIDAHLHINANGNGMMWSQFLEEYTLNLSTQSDRTGKDLLYPNSGPTMNFMSASNINDLGGSHLMHPSHHSGERPQVMNYYSNNRYIPTNNPGIFISKRIGEAAELEPHMRPPAKVINPQFRPMTKQQENHYQSILSGSAGSSGQVVGGLFSQQQQQQQQSQNHPPTPNQQFRAVSENDLYLLGAIEKLVYRVDYLESRIRRSEQLIYYLMAGNNQKEVRDPCPRNFTRISENCYYINSDKQVNWKTANTACKASNAHLAEFERMSENEELIAFLLNQPNHRGRDFWLGGLNPGLLWIWSNSAKPINPNMNLTSIAMSHDNNSNSSSTSKPSSNTSGDHSENDASNETILNNTAEIKGHGRCLRLSYNPAKHSYMYFGQECTSRHHFICEYEDKTLDNKIKKISRELQLE